MAQALRIDELSEKFAGEWAHRRPAWLAKRILQDNTIDENERALLAFLKKEAHTIDPALEPVLARAKL